MDIVFDDIIEAGSVVGIGIDCEDGNCRGKLMGLYVIEGDILLIFVVIFNRRYKHVPNCFPIVENPIHFLKNIVISK
jgi:hypothetical protein